MPSAVTDIIVIGGSTGSGTVLRQLLPKLPLDLPASVLVSTHMPSHARGLLATVLASSSALPVVQAVEAQVIEYGHVYVAVPDRHLLIANSTIHLGLGPRENMVRPAIDALFRSVALAHGPRVIGVVLTGMLNDGAAGLRAIKAQGGVAVVQDPASAESDQMPLAALAAVDVDHVCPGDGLAHLLRAIVGKPAGPTRPVPESLRLEVEIAAGAPIGSDVLARFAHPCTISCPDCQGVLSEINDGPLLRYRCQVGTPILPSSS